MAARVKKSVRKVGKRTAPKKKAAKKKVAPKKPARAKKVAAKPVAAAVKPAPKAPAPVVVPKPPVPKPKPAAAPPAPMPSSGTMTAAEVNLGHIAALRPRTHTGFKPEAFAEAKRTLADARYGTIEEAARAVAEKAVELSNESGPDPFPTH